VSRKVGNSVVRNRVKRRIRESLRSVDLPQVFDVVVIAHPRAADTPVETLARELADGFAQIGGGR
jgi:ribonuclease P protein component